LLLAVGTLILCSCRSPNVVMDQPLPPEAAVSSFPEAGETPRFGAGAQAACAGCSAAGSVAALPPALPYSVGSTWQPPGIAGPWPANEYLCDGGDYGSPASAGFDQELRGLEPEDALAQYETEDGRRVVQPSNRVCIYAPRFGAIRSVVAANSSAQVEMLDAVDEPLRLANHEEVLTPTSSLQKLQPKLNSSAKLARHYRMRQGNQIVSAALIPDGFASGFAPFEDLAIIRDGHLKQDEKARLAIAVDAAITWSHVQAVQVVLDGEAATAFTGDQLARATYTIDQPPSNPKLRVIKVASTQTAEPGDPVNFTIRFDNVGNQTIHNITIVDHLTTRLEYLADTAQASVAAHFATESPDGATLILRWQIDKPLEPGDGGIMRFRCRVR